MIEHIDERLQHFNVPDFTRDACMLKGKLREQGYDWWWHSLTGVNEATGEEKAFFNEGILMSTESSELKTAPIPRLFWKMALPAVVAQVISLLYNIVDRIFIGHIAGDGTAALTGVGLFMPILMLIESFAMLVGSGGAPLASMQLGREEKERAEAILNTSFRLLLIFSIILTPVFFFFAPQLLIFFGASSETLPFALNYARIYILGAVTVLFTYGLNTFISAQGFAATAMLSTVIGAVINIALDPVLIFACHLGVAGAAIATVASQAVSAVWILAFLCGRHSGIRIRLHAGKMSGRTIRAILSLGASTFVMISTESLLSMAFNHSLERYGGDMAVGAMTIITSVASLISMPVNGFAQGAAPIISYNYGAGINDRVRKTFRLLLATSVIYAGIFWAVIQLAPGFLAHIFTNDSRLIAYTVWAMHIYFAVIITNGFQTSCQQSFVALGQARISLLLALFRKMILLIPLILLLPHFMSDKVFSVFLAEPICDASAAAVTTTAFVLKSRKILSDEVKEA